MRSNSDRLRTHLFLLRRRAHHRTHNVRGAPTPTVAATSLSSSPWLTVSLVVPYTPESSRRTFVRPFSYVSANASFSVSSHNNVNNEQLIVPRISSSHTEDPSWTELHRWTETILNPHETSLGSLHPITDWQDVLTAMQFWLETNVPRHLDLCDKLLQRLLMEHHSRRRHHGCHSGAQEQQQQLLLQAWMVKVREAWLRVAQIHPGAPLPVQRARVWWEEEQVFRTTFDQSTSSNNNIDAAIAACLQLVQAELRLAQSGGPSSPHTWPAFQRATDMLLSDFLVSVLQQTTTTPPDESWTVAMWKDCYQQVVRLLTRQFSTATKRNAENDSNANSTESASSLSLTISHILEQMEQLSQQPGWEDLRFEDEELNQIIDTIFLERDNTTDASSSSSKNKRLSNFEQQVLRQRILQRIQNASSVDERAEVEELVQYWRTHMMTDDATIDSSWKPFAQAVVAYYLRIQDPVQSSKWLQIQDASHVFVNGDDAVDDNNGPGADKPMDSLLPVFPSTDSTPSITAETSSSRLERSERFEQKLNLLKVWASKRDTPSAPYRATELLQSLEADCGDYEGHLLLLDAQPYVTTVRLWLEQQQGGVGSRKALEIAMRCPTFDPTLLSLVFQALREEQKAGRATNPTRFTTMVNLWKDRYDDIPIETNVAIAENVFDLLATDSGTNSNQGAPALLNFLLEQKGNVVLSASVCENAIRASPANQVGEVLHRFESKNANLLTLDGYRAALRRLLDEGDALNMSNVRELYLRILKAAKSQQIECSASQAANMFLDILYCAKKSDESTILSLLLQIEDQFVRPTIDSTSNTPGIDAASPIPRDFFAKTMVLLEQHRMLDATEKLFLRLKEYSKSGLCFLDSAIYRSYAHLLQTVHSVDSVDKRVELVTELVDLYENSNRAPENKPLYDMFDGIVAGLRLRSKANARHGSYEKYEQDATTALSLIDIMHRLEIVPDKLDRVYAFNITMEIILGSSKKNTCYSRVMEVKRKMLDLGLQPNHLTHIALIRAAELTPLGGGEGKQGGGLTVMLDSLVELRRQNKADALLYMSCFRSLLRAKGSASTPAPELEKIAAMIFQCCCNDGALTSYAKSALERLCAKEIVDQIYTQHLSKDAKMPASWTRKAHGFF